MAGLDQGRHPMRFAVTASTVSGLLVVLATAAAGRVWRSWPDRYALPVLALGLGWMLVALPLVLRARHRDCGSRRVFLIVDAFTHKHWAGMPVVFVDAKPFESGDAYPPGTAYAGCDDEKIGVAAAQWVARYLHGKRIRRPVVLIINGGRLPHRERMFRMRLEAEVPGVNLISDCAGFDRPQATQVVAAHLRQLDAADRRLHAVFCTNDEMALGAADALVFAGIPWAGDVIVAGVDGTPDARALITAGPGPLRAPVVQDSY